jgi:hypothetical protein
MKTRMIAVNAIVHQTRSAIIVLKPTSATTAADEIAKRTNNVKRL